MSGNSDNPQYLKPLRFWVNLVTPLVYDDTLTLYETMRKVVHTLNEVIAIVNPLGAGIEDTINKYLEQYKVEWTQELVEFEQRMEANIQNNNEAINERINQMQTDITEQQTEYEKSIDDKFATLNAQIVQQIATLAATIKSSDDANRVWTLAQISKLKEDFTANFPPVIDPSDGLLETVQTALNHMWDAWRGNALTAEEYDALELTATEYDNKQLTAKSYDDFGKILLVPETNSVMVAGVPVGRKYIDTEGITNGIY